MCAPLYTQLTSDERRTNFPLILLSAVLTAYTFGVLLVCGWPILVAASLTC